MNNKNERIEVLDILRGVAIATIMIIHCSNNFLFNSGRVEEIAWIEKLDYYTKEILYFLVEGKAYAVFALLFGFTYALQLDNQIKKGGDFGGRMVWRMIILIVFGIFNAFFFSGGDPLIFYSLAMMVVIPMRKWNNNAIIITSLLLFLQPIEIINSFNPFIDNIHYTYYSELANAVANKNFLDVGITNITSGVKGALIWALETGRFTQTLGLFLLGIWLYRKKFVYNSDTQFMSCFITMFLLSTMLYIINYLLPHPCFMMNYKLTFSLMIVCFIILLYRRYSHSKIFKYFQNYGRMSLTNFILQSIIGSCIFYPWGLNLSSYIGASLSILIGIIIVIIQIYLSDIWIRRVGKGPLETLWHKLTWIKI